VTGFHGQLKIGDRAVGYLAVGRFKALSDYPLFFVCLLFTNDVPLLEAVQKNL
jgi:hypothetical protein